MNIFIYSDESGVFDVKHNNYYVFGGLIILGKKEQGKWSNAYISAENALRRRLNVSRDVEIKAATISNRDKTKLYRALNQCYKFGGIVNQKDVHTRIFESKKDKQRYLDYVYKLSIKNALKEMMERHIINVSEIDRLYFFVDEHTTATNGKYELKEALERELICGTYNYHWNHFYEPLMPGVQSLELKYCNSASTTLVRAADIVANRLYYIANNSNNYSYEVANRNLFIKRFP